MSLEHFLISKTNIVSMVEMNASWSEPDFQNSLPPSGYSINGNEF